MRLGSALAVIALASLIFLRPVLPLAKGARLVTAFTWQNPPRGVGGLSAITIGEMGRTAVVLVDRGSILSLRLERDGDVITDAVVTAETALFSGTRPSKVGYDSEGIAIGADGAIYVSYEQDQRIQRYDQTTGAQTAVPTPRAFEAFGANTGLEALAIDRKGHLYTLPERPRSLRQGFPVWHWDGAAWSRPYHLRPRNGFLVVAADFGPDGRLYLLERRLTFLGFQSRLRRWEADAESATDEAILLTTRAGEFGNLEGLSLWRDKDNRMRATMVSDNNFLPVMRAQIVEFVLTE